MTTNQEAENTLTRKVQAAFADLDTEHLAILGAMGESRRLGMVCELADFARESYAIQVRMVKPDASGDELWSEIRRRMGQREHA
jgi:hypothetical protein